MNNNKKEFSKKMAIASFLPFIFCVLFTAFLMLKNTDLNDTIIVAMFSATAGIAATTNVFYLRKSQTENTYKVKMSLYRDAADVNIEYMRKRLELQKEYGDLDSIESESPITDMMSEALTDVKDSVAEDMNDATQRIEKEEIIL